MKNGAVQIYCGMGMGKSMAAMGYCLQRASCGAHVIMIQFLKGKELRGQDFLSRLEPEIKLFRFEKEPYGELTKEQRKEERANILNGFNFARKVLETGECTLLFLDEVLELLDFNIITVEELVGLMQSKSEECELLLTGRSFPKKLAAYADVISEVRYMKM